MADSAFCQRNLIMMIWVLFIGLTLLLLWMGMVENAMGQNSSQANNITAPMSGGEFPGRVPGDERYNPQIQLVSSTLRSPGYHTTLPDGVTVHATRDAANYIVALLRTNHPGRIERAQGVLRQLLSLQDTEPTNNTYGIWPWFYEEPLAKMSPPDWNWADFIGAQLAEVLRDHADKLPEDLRSATRAALGHASRAIIQRNVRPGYTNISVMGGVVTAAAGELLDDAGILEYGRNRLREFVAHTQHHGGFTEYNSPTYTMITLEEADRGLYLVRDPATREALAFIHHHAWQLVADHFHPATREWAGPHARTYNDRLTLSAARQLSRLVGVSIQAPDAPGDARHLPGLSPTGWRRACPPELVERFTRLPTSPLAFTQTYSRDEVRGTLIGSTWMNEWACLGSINADSAWTQRRPVIAYWLDTPERVMVLRVRYQRDERDFSTAFLHSHQQAQRVLTTARFRPGFGDWHPSLDRSKDNHYTTVRLAMRIELIGEGGTIHELEKGRYELRGQTGRAVIHVPTELRNIDGASMAWEVGRSPASADGKSPARVWVDGIWHQGQARRIDFSNVIDRVGAVGIELLKLDEPASRAAVTLQGQKSVSWALPTPMEVTLP